MSFLKSAINQVGRDMGKVASNQIFGNAHSTPYRGVRQSVSTQQPSRRNSKSNFEKAIGFPTSHRPNTLINKLLGVFTEMKSEVRIYISDGYLDVDESDKLFRMFGAVNEKIVDVYEVLEIDESGNHKEIDQLTKIANKTANLFCETLKTSVQGCKDQSLVMERKADSVSDVSFGKYVGLCTIWMRNYAETGTKNLGSTIIANILSFFMFPIAHVIAALIGLATYSGVKNKREKLRDSYLKMADIELRRARVYSEISESEIYQKDLLN